jgi:hypothetical protein
VRWEEPRDPDQPPPPRRWGVAVAVAGLGIALVTGATLLPGSPPPPAHGGTVTARTVDEPTGRGGLSHRAPIAPTTAPAPVAAAPVAEAAATTWATTSVPAAAPLVARGGQACDVQGATAVAADGTALICQGGKGTGVPRWHKA